MSKFKREAPLLSTQSLAIILAACGGGGGGSNTSTARLHSNVVTREGRVIDGPIVGATVYVDINQNGEVDAADIRIGQTNGEGLYSGEVNAEHADKLLIAA